MKRIYTQSEPKKLFTGIRSTFSFKENKSRVNIFSQKLIENPIFDKPLNNVSKTL